MHEGFASVVGKENCCIRLWFILKTCRRVEVLQKEKVFGHDSSFKTHNGRGRSGILHIISKCYGTITIRMLMVLISSNLKNFHFLVMLLKHINHIS